MANTFATFWMVYVECERGPTIKHVTETAAKAEAERLARLTPGKSVFVLKAISACQVEQPPLVWRMADDEIPF